MRSRQPAAGFVAGIMAVAFWVATTRWPQLLDWVGANSDTRVMFQVIGATAIAFGAWLAYGLIARAIDRR